jgi:hypothetical protein
MESCSEFKIFPTSAEIRESEVSWPILGRYSCFNCFSACCRDVSQSSRDLMVWRFAF